MAQKKLLVICLIALELVYMAVTAKTSKRK